VRLAATVTAAGGGTLLAAVALQLVPAADQGAGPALTALGLAAGTLAYVGADASLTRDPGMREMRRMGHAMVAGQAPPMADEATEREVVAAGIFVDGVPESVALGLTVAGAGSASRCSSGCSWGTSSSPTARRTSSCTAGGRGGSRSHY